MDTIIELTLNKSTYISATIATTRRAAVALAYEHAHAVSAHLTASVGSVVGNEQSGYDIDDRISGNSEYYQEYDYINNPNNYNNHNNLSSHNRPTSLAAGLMLSYASAPMTTIFLAILLSIMILFIIVGNSFVIIGILFDKNLHRTQYYLILSLAVADLLVGMLVSPVAAVYEISQQWFMGPHFCDLWTWFDVMGCTSSILHLAAIALDRYWSVSDVTYARNRTTKKILIMVSVIWSVSLVTSIGPAVGWKDAGHQRRLAERQCMISQAVSYQIFSTITAFYAPLVLICFLYYKIFKAAQYRIRLSQMRRRSSITNTVSGEQTKVAGGRPGNSTTEDERRFRIFTKLRAVNSFRVASCDSQSTLLEKSPLKRQRSEIQRYPKLKDTQVTIKDGAQVCELTNNVDSDEISAYSSGVPDYGAASETSPVREQRSGSRNHFSSVSLADPSSEASTIHRSSASKTHLSADIAATFLTTRSPWDMLTRNWLQKLKGGSDLMSGSQSSPAPVESKREKRAWRTVAIITSVFVCCWLPFFVLALYRPLCHVWYNERTCQVPRVLESLFSWLGMMNSALNPILYTIFNPDFKAAFKNMTKRCFDRCTCCSLICTTIKCPRNDGEQMTTGRDRETKV